MKPRRLLLLLFVMLTSACGFEALTAFHDTLHRGLWVNEPLHSSVEMLGAMAAIYMALILLQRRRETEFAHLFFPALGFLGMGIFDTYHSVCSPGQAFVFLHSVAGLAGGVGFALIWASGWVNDAKRKAQIAWIVTSCAMLAGVWFLALPGMLPEMVSDQQFTNTAAGINIFAGVLFLIGASYFGRNFYRSRKVDDALFLFLSGLFALAALIFEYSSLWDAEWWLWHLLRLGAYLIVMGFLVYAHQQSRRQLRESEEQHRALFEQNVDALVVIDPETGLVLDFNERACENLGYTREEFQHIPLAALDVNSSTEEIAERIRRIQEEGKDAFETKLRKKSGKMRDVEVGSRLITVGGRTLIQSVWHDVTERKKSEQRLNASLKEKEILLREIHHRVKNNMQVVISLLQLQAEQITDPKARAAFVDSQNRIMAMAEVHETLYRSDSLASVSCREYLNKLLDGIGRSHRGASAKLSTEICDQAIHIDQAVPLGLIVNELVSNAMKHAFPNGRRGHVKISMRVSEQEFKLDVSDNGVGLPEEFDRDTNDSLGLRLVTGLTRHQLGGTLEISSNNGTRFVIIFERKKTEEIQLE